MIERFLFWVFSVLVVVFCLFLLLLRRVFGCNIPGMTRYRRGRYMFK